MRMGRMGVVIAAVCVVLLMTAGGVMGAARPCSFVGTWTGVVDLGGIFVTTCMPGSNATTGEMSLNWIANFDPTFYGNFPTAVRSTELEGVWQKVNAHEFTYTYVGYGMDATNAVVYTWRASGGTTLADCDHGNITYVIEFWLAGQNMNTDPPVACMSGTAVSTRMALVQASCPQ